MINNKYLVLPLVLWNLSFGSAYAAPSLGQSSSPVDLQADRLVHDENGQSVTATGDVILVQDGRTVKADEIVYNLKQDTVIATGHVEFIEVSGDHHYADRFEFNDALKDGFVNGLQTFLADGSRFKAASGQYNSGNKTVMKNAFYTACETCKDNADAPPIWQIRASEVEHDEVNKTIKYRNARFEIKGVPVAYMPYFKHPDGSVERKSGFLTPTAGYSSDLGASVQESYYWSIAPDKDLTVGMRAMTRQAPLGLLEWRQRWENASIKAAGSTTYSARTDRIAGVDVVQKDDLRGNLTVNGLWDVNDKWRSGANIAVVSDNQYLRQYGFDRKDILENEIFAERFSGRNYAVGRALAFQDIRVDDSIEEEQPHVLPEIQASFLGEPGSVPLIGGRWSADMSLLGLVRNDDAQDMNRAFAALGWQRRLVSDYGFVSVVNANMQGAFYDVNDRTGATSSTSIEKNSREGRAFGYVNAQTSYPLEKKFSRAQMVIEPTVAVTVAPTLGLDSDIPDEDSQDIQVNALNLFEPDRFPGIDMVEDQSHVTYGMRTGLYGDQGSYGDVFLGQSYRFDNEDNPFVQGSGLDEKNSDVVGQISASYQGDYTIDYRVQLDNKSLASQRHEVDAGMQFNKLKLSTRYLYAKGLDGTAVDDTREQIRNSASYYIDDNWRVYGSARHDLREGQGLRQADLGLDYTGQCVSLSVVGTRNLTDDSSGDSGSEIFLRIGFKNLGEFKTSGVQLGGNNE